MKKKKSPSELVCARLPIAMAKAFRSACKRRKIPRTAVIRHGVRMFLEAIGEMPDISPAVRNSQVHPKLNAILPIKENE